MTRLAAPPVPRVVTVDNPDGSVSSERTISVSVEELNEGRTTVIPTLVEGKQLSDDEAIRFAIQSGLQFPSFDSIEDAKRFAKRRSDSGAAGAHGFLGTPRSVLPTEMRDTLEAMSRYTSEDPTALDPAVRQTLDDMESGLLVDGWEETKRRDRKSYPSAPDLAASIRRMANVDPSVSAVNLKLDPNLETARQRFVQNLLWLQAAQEPAFLEGSPEDRFKRLQQLYDESGLTEAGVVPPDPAKLPGERGVVEIVGEKIVSGKIVPFLRDALWIGGTADALAATRRVAAGDATTTDFLVLTAYQEQLMDERRGSTGMGGVFDIATEMLPLAIEFGMALGAYTVVKGGVKAGARALARPIIAKALEKKLSKEAIRSLLARPTTEAARRIARKQAVQTAGKMSAWMGNSLGLGTVGSATVWAPRVATDQFEFMMPTVSGFFDPEAGDYQFVVVDDGQGWSEALANAYVGNVIEIVGETTSKPLAFVFRGVTRPIIGQITKRIPAVGQLTSKLGATARGVEEATRKQLRMKLPLSDVIRNTGFIHGPVSEVAEEDVTAFLKMGAEWLSDDRLELYPRLLTFSEALQLGAAVTIFRGVPLGASYALHRNDTIALQKLQEQGADSWAAVSELGNSSMRAALTSAPLVQNAMKRDMTGALAFMRKPSRRNLYAWVPEAKRAAQITGRASENDPITPQDRQAMADMIENNLAILKNHRGPALNMADKLGLAGFNPRSQVQRELLQDTLQLLERVESDPSFAAVSQMRNQEALLGETFGIGIYESGARMSDPIARKQYIKDLRRLLDLSEIHEEPDPGAKPVLTAPQQAFNSATPRAAARRLQGLDQNDPAFRAAFWFDSDGQHLDFPGVALASAVAHYEIQNPKLQDDANKRFQQAINGYIAAGQIERAQQALDVWAEYDPAASQTHGAALNLEKHVPDEVKREREAGRREKAEGVEPLQEGTRVHVRPDATKRRSVKGTIVAVDDDGLQVRIGTAKSQQLIRVKREQVRPDRRVRPAARRGATELRQALIDIIQTRRASGELQAMAEMVQGAEGIDFQSFLPPYVFEGKGEAEAARENAPKHMRSQIRWVGELTPEERQRVGTLADEIGSQLDLILPGVGLNTFIQNTLEFQDVREVADRGAKATKRQINRAIEHLLKDYQREVGNPMSSYTAEDAAVMLSWQALNSGAFEQVQAGTLKVGDSIELNGIEYIVTRTDDKVELIDGGGEPALVVGPDFTMTFDEGTFVKSARTPGQAAAMIDLPTSRRAAEANLEAARRHDFGPKNTPIVLRNREDDQRFDVRRAAEGFEVFLSDTNGENLRGPWLFSKLDDAVDSISGLPTTEQEIPLGNFLYAVDSEARRNPALIDEAEVPFLPEPEAEAEAEAKPKPAAAEEAPTGQTKFFDAPIADYGNDPVKQTPPTTGSTGAPLVQPYNLAAGSTINPVGGPTPRPVPNEYKKQRTTNKTQILQALSDVLLAFRSSAAQTVAPIRKGVFGRKVMGYFISPYEVRRVRDAGDFTTGAHETGHALETLIWGNSFVDKNNRRFFDTVKAANARKELIALGKSIYPGARPTAGYQREGFGEFLSLWVEDRAGAKTAAPNFYQHFDNVVLNDHPQGRRALDHVTTLVERWHAMTALQQVEASRVDPAKPGEIAKRAARWLKYKVKPWVRRTWFESFEPLEQFMATARVKAGLTIDQSVVGTDIFEIASFFRGSAQGIVEQWAKNGVSDLVGASKGIEGLTSINRLIKGQEMLKDWVSFLHARRALALWQPSKKFPNGRDPGITQEQAEAALQELQEIYKDPELSKFEQAADIYYRWNEGVLDYVAQASPSLAQMVARMRAADPGYYMPLAREMDDVTSSYHTVDRSTLGKADPSAVFRRLRGSTRRIVAPLETTLNNAVRMVQNAQQTLILDHLIRIAETVPGMGAFVERIPRNRELEAQRTVREVLEKLKAELSPTASKDPAAEQIVEAIETAQHEVSDDLLGQMVAFFSPATKPKADPDKRPRVPVWRNGEIQFYEFDPGIFNAVRGVSPENLLGTGNIIRALSVPARMARLGNTAYRASFGLVTNPIRDLQTLLINSQANGNAFELFYGWQKGMLDGALGALPFANVQRSPMWQLFVGQGASIPQIRVGIDVGQTKRLTRKIAGFDVRDLWSLEHGPRTAKAAAGKVLTAYTDLIQFPETASRVAEMTLIARDVGWEPGTPITFDQMVKIVMAGKRATVDFSASGDWSRSINQIVPFFNATLQGARLFARNLFAGSAGNRARSWLRGMTLFTVPTMMLWWYNREKEWYKELDERERSLYWHVEVPFSKEILRIPRAFEFGQLFASIPERLADLAYRQDPETMERFFGETLGAWTPVQFTSQALLGQSPNQAALSLLQQITPTAALVPLESLMNRNLFSNRPIVSDRLKRRFSEEQYDGYTTRFAMSLGRLFGTSPKKIDHAIKGTFGGVSRDVLELFGLGDQDILLEPQWSQKPVIGRIVQRRPGPSPRSVNRLYDKLGVALKIQGSEKLEETELQREQRLMMMGATRTWSLSRDMAFFTPKIEDREAIQDEALADVIDVLDHLDRGETRKKRNALAANITEEGAALQKWKQQGVTGQADLYRRHREWWRKKGNRIHRRDKPLRMTPSFIRSRNRFGAAIEHLGDELTLED